MKFVFIVAASVLAFTFSDGELPLAKMCCMRGKTRDKYVCRRQIISRNAEMARVANVERGNFVSEYQWHILRTTNNIRPTLCLTRKAISSLRRDGEKHALVSTRNVVVHQVTGEVVLKKGKATYLPGYNLSPVPEAWNRSGSRRRG